MGRELLQDGWDALVEAGFRGGDFADAERLLEAARTQARDEGDRATEAATLDGLGMLAHYANIAILMRGGSVADAEVDAERSRFEAALALHRAVDDTAGSAQSLFGLGLVAQVMRHDWASAIHCFREALTISEREPAVDLYTRSEIHRHIGFYHLVDDVQPQLAVAHLRASLNLREQLADPRRIPSGILALGQAELAAGHRDEGIELLQRAVTEARQASLSRERVADAEHELRAAQAEQ